jgi:pimeloyl-ACP methyl ester carboxylesterase
VILISQNSMTSNHKDQISPRSHIGVSAPFEMVDAGGTRLAVSRTGAGQPVFCLHATGHGGRDFEGFANFASQHKYEIICVDWPGHGNSPRDAKGRTASATVYASLLSELIPALCGGQKPIIVGNSIGGAAALSFATDHPDQVRALVLCNPGGLAPLDGLAKAVIGAMVSFFGAGQAGAKWFPAAFALFYRLVLPAKPAFEQRARIVAAGPEMAPLLRQAWDSFRQDDASLRARAAKLTLPCLFAWAKQDQIVAWSRSKDAVLAMPNAQVQMFKGGHSSFLEDPDRFNAGFLTFTAGLEA